MELTLHICSLADHTLLLRPLNDLRKVLFKRFQERTFIEGVWRVPCNKNWILYPQVYRRPVLAIEYTLNFFVGRNVSPALGSVLCQGSRCYMPGWSTWQPSEVKNIDGEGWNDVSSMMPLHTVEIDRILAHLRWTAAGIRMHVCL